MASYPESKTSVALFDCPYCIDNFAFDYEKIRNLAFRWRVMVRCPGCENVIEVVMKGYQVIHNCDPAAYKQGEIVEIYRLTRRLLGLDYSLRMAFTGKNMDGGQTRVLCPLRQASVRSRALNGFNYVLATSCMYAMSSPNVWREGVQRMPFS